MKKVAIFVLTVALLAAMVIPAFTSAANAVLLKKVNFLTDTFETVNKESDGTFKFSDKYDLSKSTADALVPIKKDGVSDDNWNAKLSYFTRTGYKISDSTGYTICFEMGVLHGGWFGVPLAIEKTSGDILMIGGAMADNGEQTDSATGTNWSQIVIAHNNPNTSNNVGEGYNEHGWLFYHPKLTTETVASDNCQGDAVTEAKFSTLKVEFVGKKVVPYYLNDSGEFVKMSDTFTYEVEEGSEIVLGTFAREQHRHGITRNIYLVEGTGLSLSAIQNAAPASQQGQQPSAPATGDNAVIFATVGAIACLAAGVLFARKKARSH